MDEKDLRRWFSEYLEAFAACCLGRADASSLLAYYGVPILLTLDAAYLALTSAEQVVATLEPQVEGLRAAQYARSETLELGVTALNAKSALLRGTFSRRRADGSEINRVTATYLVTDGAPGRRISVLAVESA